MSQQLSDSSRDPNAGSRTALVCTLGGKPQVATLALDELLARGVAVQRIYAVHLSQTDPRISHSLARLQAEFPAAGPTIAPRFESIVVRDRPSPALLSISTMMEGRAIERIDEPAAADACWLTFNRLIGALKAEDYTIELCLAGGPRLIALQALSVASLLFTSQDHCWHLHTSRELLVRGGEGAIMHVRRAPDDPPVPGLEGVDTRVRLIRVPLIPLGNLLPHLQTAAYLAPEQIIAQRVQQLGRPEEQRCRQVWRALTPRQREVLREFARGAKNAVEVAQRLTVERSTVNTHKTIVYEQCRIAWELPPDAKLDFHFLREHFGPLDYGFWV